MKNIFEQAAPYTNVKPEYIAPFDMYVLDKQARASKPEYIAPFDAYIMDKQAAARFAFASYECKKENARREQAENARARENARREQAAAAAREKSRRARAKLAPQGLTIASYSKPAPVQNKPRALRGTSPAAPVQNKPENGQAVFIVQAGENDIFTVYASDSTNARMIASASRPAAVKIKVMPALPFGYSIEGLNAAALYVFKSIAANFASVCANAAARDIEQAARMIYARARENGAQAIAAALDLLGQKGQAAALDLFSECKLAIIEGLNVMPAPLALHDIVAIYASAFKRANSYIYSLRKIDAKTAIMQFALDENGEQVPVDKILYSILYDGEFYSPSSRLPAQAARALRDVMQAVFTACPPRQKKTAALLYRSYTPDMIADVLDVKPQTVYGHIAALRGKLEQALNANAVTSTFVKISYKDMLAARQEIDGKKAAEYYREYRLKIKAKKAAQAGK